MPPENCRLKLSWQTSVGDREGTEGVLRCVASSEDCGSDGVSKRLAAASPTAHERMQAPEPPTLTSPAVHPVNTLKPCHVLWPWSAF